MEVFSRKEKAAKDARTYQLTPNETIKMSQSFGSKVSEPTTGSLLGMRWNGNIQNTLLTMDYFPNSILLGLHVRAANAAFALA